MAGMLLFRDQKQTALMNNSDMLLELSIGIFILQKFQDGQIGIRIQT